MRAQLVVAAAALFPHIMNAQAKPIVIHADRMVDGRGHVTPERDRRRRRCEDHERRRRGRLAGDVRSQRHDTHTGFDRCALASHLVFQSAGEAMSGDDGDTPEQSMLSMVGNAYATLISGVTTIQSPGSPEDHDLREWIEVGQIPGPRVLTSLSPIQNARLSPDSMRAIVRERKAQGADVIKIFASASIRDGGALTLSQDQLNAICSEAKAVGHSHDGPRAQHREHQGVGARRLQPDRARRICGRRYAEVDGRSRRVLRSADLSRLPELSRQPREVRRVSATTTRPASRRWRKRFQRRRRCSSTRSRRPD